MNVQRLLTPLFVGFLTFSLGIVVSYPFAIPTTLEAISRDIGSYEGKVVEVETYAQVDDLVEWTAGEPFEKFERMTFIKFSQENSELLLLRQSLSSNYRDVDHLRVKVRVRGLVEDNCNDGIPCCFGETMTLKNATLSVIGTIETHSRPQ